MTVIFPYDGKLEDDLDIKPGDVITVDDWDVSNDLARGTLNDKTGLFYKAFVKPSSEVPSPDDLKLNEVRGKPQGYEACYQGREYVLKEKLDEVECIVCQELAGSAHQTSCCGNTVCLQCASKWKGRNNSCPQCRKAPLDIVVDPKTQRRITRATVYCPNYHFGCDWVDGFGHVAQHLAADCEFEGKKCPNSECEEVVPEKFLVSHASNLCLWRREACPYCGLHRKSKREALTYRDIIIAHQYNCLLWPTRCPKSCDSYLTLTRSSVDIHARKECPQTMIDCKFAGVGCRVRRKRKEMPGHMKDVVSDHLTAMFEDHMKLKNENAQQKRENAQLKRELNQLKECVQKK